MCEEGLLGSEPIRERALGMCVARAMFVGGEFVMLGLGDIVIIEVVVVGVPGLGREMFERAILGSFVSKGSIATVKLVLGAMWMGLCPPPPPPYCPINGEMEREEGAGGVPWSDRT